MMECNICGVKDQRNIFNCDGCRASVCKKCGGLTSPEVKVMESCGNRVMRFHCSKCLKNETYKLLWEIIESKDQIIESKDEIIGLLKQEIEQIKVNKDSGKTNTYSEILQKSNEEVLVVKPKIKPKNEKKSSEATKQTLEKNISPASLGIGISKMKYIREGGVAISYGSGSDARSICREVEVKLGHEYEVRIPDKQNPKITVYSVDEKILEDEEDFKDKIILQNRITTDPQDLEIKVIHKYETKKHRTNVIVQIDPITYSQIKRKNTIYIDWRTCYYADYVNLIQCFKCWKYGHKSDKCSSKKDICPKCASEHRASECDASQEVCVNCRYASETLKVPNVSYNHSAFSKECEAYKRIFKKLQQRVNYPEIHQLHNI